MVKHGRRASHTGHTQHSCRRNLQAEPLDARRSSGYRSYRADTQSEFLARTRSELLAESEHLPDHHGPVFRRGSFKQQFLRRRVALHRQQDPRWRLGRGRTETRLHQSARCHSDLALAGAEKWQRRLRLPRLCGDRFLQCRPAFRQLAGPAASRPRGAEARLARHQRRRGEPRQLVGR